MGQELQGTSSPSSSSSPRCRHSGGSSGMGRRSSSPPCPTSTRSSTASSASGTPSPSSPTASSSSAPSTPSAQPSSWPTPRCSSPTPTPRRGLVPTAFPLPSASLTCGFLLLQLKVSMLLVAVFCAFGLIVYVSMVLFDHKPRQMFVGYLSVASLICMFASPLSIINLVIKTKSVEYMPFYLSLSMSLMSVSFFAYGLLLDDFFIYIPNGIGTILGVIQLLLYAYFRKGSRDEARRPLLVTHT